MTKKATVCQQQVTYDLRVVERRWRESAVASLAEHRVRLLAGSEQRKRVVWADYEASKSERRSTTSRQRTVPSVARPPVEHHRANGHLAERIERSAQVRVEERDPDWHLLDLLRKEDEFQARLLGQVDTPPAQDPDPPVWSPLFQWFQTRT